VAVTGPLLQCPQVLLPAVCRRADEDTAREELPRVPPPHREGYQEVLLTVLLGLSDALQEECGGPCGVDMVESFGGGNFGNLCWPSRGCGVSDEIYNDEVKLESVCT